MSDNVEQEPTGVAAYVAPALQKTEEISEKLANLVNQFFDGVDTGYTWTRVSWYLWPEFVGRYLWTLPGISINAAVTLAFGALFPIKDYFHRKRLEQVNNQQYVFSQLSKTLKTEINRSQWIDKVGFFEKEKLLSWYKKAHYKIRFSFRQLLEVKTDNDVIAIFEKCWNAKQASHEPLTLKLFLEWILDYLKEQQKQTEKAKKRQGDYQLLSTEEIDALSGIVSISEEKRQKLREQLFDKAVKESESEPNVKSGWFAGAVNFLFGNVPWKTWETMNQYTLNFWIVKAFASIFQKPGKAGDLSATTGSMFLFSLIGPLANFWHFIIKSINNKLLPSQKDEAKNKEQEKIFNQAYFAKKQRHFLKLLLNLEHHYFLEDLLEIPTIDNKGKEKTIEWVDYTVETVTAKTIQNDLFQSGQKNSWFQKIIASRAGTVIAQSIAAFVSFFAATSFAFWVFAGELATSLFPSNYILTHVVSFGFMSGTIMDFAGIGISIGIGIIAAILTGYKSYQTYTEMEKKYAAERKNLKALAARQNQLNQLRVKIQRLQNELQADINSEELTGPGDSGPAFTLKMLSMQSTLPDFVKMDAINYHRFYETLSFKNTIWTLLKKTGNRLLAVFVGSITGSLVVRMTAFSFATVLSGISFAALVSVNPPAAAVLGTLFVASVLIVAGVRLWNYHLNRIKKDQENFLKQIPSCKKVLEEQILVCKKQLNSLKAAKAGIKSSKPEESTQYLSYKKEGIGKNPHGLMASKQKIPPASTIEEDDSNLSFSGPASSI